jgi:hypothetical protein
VIVTVAAAMVAPRGAAFGQGGDRGFYCFLPGHRRFADDLSLGRERGGERVASRLEFFDLGVGERGVAEFVQTVNRPAAQRHANVPADLYGAMQAPSESVPVVLVVLPLKVLAVNSVPLASALRQRDDRRDGGSQSGTGSKNGQDSARRKHAKPPWW